MERRRPCPEPLRGCQFDEPYADDHHLFWPANEYRTPLEMSFRECDVNIIRGICRCIHNLEHLKRPPKKPPVEIMRGVLDGQA